MNLFSFLCCFLCNCASSFSSLSNTCEPALASHLGTRFFAQSCETNFHIFVDFLMVNNFDLGRSSAAPYPTRGLPSQAGYGEAEALLVAFIGWWRNFHRYFEVHFFKSISCYFDESITSWRFCGTTVEIFNFRYLNGSTSFMFSMNNC